MGCNKSAFGTNHNFGTEMRETDLYSKENAMVKFVESFPTAYVSGVLYVAQKNGIRSRLVFKELLGGQVVI